MEQISCISTGYYIGTQNPIKFKIAGQKYVIQVSS